MAEAVLGIVLENLNSLIQKELGLFLGFDQDLERLASLFTTIKATLADAEEKQFSNRAIKDWLGKLKDAAYILDDILDECATEALGLEYQGVNCGLSDKAQCSCLSSFNPKHVAFRYKTAKRMKGISEKLKEIAEERTNFHLVQTAPERSGVNEWRQTSSIITEPQVYGREQDKDQIVDFLVGDASYSEDLSVYPIVGLGGLGKTTLAQLIFSHEKVVKHFDLRIWVCVSEDFSLKRMIKSIIETASGNACEDLDLEPLKGRLQDVLRGKRYLLVLDDVWDDEQENWQRLKSVLACGAKGASVLITTRLPTVALIMRTLPPHELSMLSENDCWELFKQQAFEPNEVEQAELVVIGKEIVKKCGGVPLAAKALGSLLRFKRQEKEWLYIKESNLWSLPHNENENSIMSALRVSYLNLPLKLRQCFAYCAIFPKDEKIEKQYLIHLWMANGFISSNEILDVEDVGDGVWHELYQRSFFQDIETDEFGKVKSFKMHDLFHDLAQSVAEDICFVNDDNDATAFSQRIHHLSDYNRGSNSTQLHRLKSLRTYLFPQRHGGKPSLDILKCYSLRGLHLKGSEELSSSIGHLKHLRYLNLSNGRFITLPESLCKLWNLQTLKLDFCIYLQKLPNSLIRLKALQELSLNGCSNLLSLPPQIGKLSSLRSLSVYFVGKERGFFLSELGAMKLKGSLHIKHLERVKSVKDAKEANMASKKLNKLCLSWDLSKELELPENIEEILEVLQPDTKQLQHLHIEEYRGGHFPQWMSSPSLKYLTLLLLEHCVNCLQLPALGKLPSLKKLRILNMLNVKYVYEEHYDGGVVFPALEFLFVAYAPNLIKLSKDDGENMFPRLSTLDIHECPKFLAGEVLLQGMHSLKYMSIWGSDKFSVSENFPCAKCLEYLSVSNCLEVEGLHEALQHMTALKELKLRNLPNFESLHDNFGNFPFLRELSICRCPKLTCLPMKLSLSSVETLRISGCPELEKRCQKETGEDWLKIAHIPHIYVPG